MEGFDKREIYFSPSLARLPNCGSAKRRVWPLTDSLALAKVAEINPKKGAFLSICAEVGTASARTWWAKRGASAGAGQQPEAAFGWEDVASGLDLMFKGLPTAPGEPRCGAAGPRSWGCTRVFLELCIATCANLLELVN